MLLQQQQRVVRVDRVITRLLRYVTSVCWCADTDRQTDSQSVAHSILTYYTDDSVAIVCLFVCHIQLRLNTTVNKLVCIDLVVVVSIRSMQMRAPISWLPNLCTGIHRIYMWARSVSRCYRPWNSRKIRCSLFLFSVKNAKIVQPWVLTKILTLISSAGWSDKSERYCRTVPCFHNIRFNKRTHPNEHRNRCKMSTKWVPKGFCIN